MGRRGLGALLYKRGDLEGAEAAYRRGDERGDAIAASNLGDLLEERGDTEGAEAAYRRGDERGDGWAAANLGALLHRRGDLEGAEAAWRRGDERGDGGAALNLGRLLAKRDLAGARAAFQRAIDSGHAKRAPAAALRLGLLLAKQRDPAGARDAFRQFWALCSKGSSSR